MESRSSRVSADLAALKLCVGQDGRVWYLNGDTPPLNSNMRAAEFAGSAAVSTLTHARVIGNAQNAPLILHLHFRQQQQRLKRLEVASPLIGRTRREREDPACLLFRMRDWQYDGFPGSLGGWHEFTQLDHPSYSAAVQLVASSSIITASIRAVIQQHPVWHILQFIPHLDQDNLCRLLALILDPRWYIDTRDPDRNNKLDHFLGLTPRVAARFASAFLPPSRGAQGGISSTHSQAYQLVLQTWRPRGEMDLEHPGCFLLRWHKAKEGMALADLRTSQAFITFLRQLWLNALYGQTNKCHDALFDPEQYFNCAATAAAFRCYASGKAAVG